MNRIVTGFAFSACLLMAQADPPGRVARLSYLYGSVSFRPGDLDDWAPADFNRPVTTGDHIYSDFGASAELELGSGALRVGSGTALEFLNLDDNNTQLRMTEGTLIVRVRYFGDQDAFEVDTPNLAVTLLRPGEYRIDVRPDSATTLVTVRGGDAELTGPNQAFTVRPGEQARVTGTDELSYQTAGAPPRDTLDNFSLQRDERLDRSPSARYCSREMVGYADLDRFGSWRDTPEYGGVWIPNNMPDGWAPYHYGHWVWVDPWGWTWVDDAPWGFAPFHFGRWAYIGGSWGWIPGPVAERPVYAPALVAWVGGGGIGIGGGIAWFALGPREVYVPSYRTSPVYLNRVNVTNTTIVNNINITNVNVTNVQYANRNAPGAVMAVQQTAFASARPVQSAAIAVRPEAIRTAQVVQTAAVAPTRASVVRIATPGARVAQPPAAIQTQQVVVRKAPPPPPVPFAAKQQALAANAGRPLDTNQVQQIRQSAPPPARPVIRQVQAPPPGQQAPAVNRPGQIAPQRTVPPPPTPALVPQTPAPQTRPLNDRPLPNQQPRQATPPPPAQFDRPAQQPPPPVTQPREVQRPAQQPPPPPAAQPRETPRPAQQAPPPPPAQPRETQRPAPPPLAPPREPARPETAPPPPPRANRPAENRPPPSDRPAPKKDEEKKKNE